ncbi:hypothetical protein [Magnetococcus sp. PR-3]|uniref:hypothetical protein n=1 Tax=Magnetococcus sp. PR-3 TaxID=3120355 RepID=UPI002FCE44EB
MPTQTEQILQILQAVLDTVPDAEVERNIAVPIKVPVGGLVILRDGDPGSPDLALGGLGGAYYSHQVEIELYVQEGDAAKRDLALDALIAGVGERLAANPTLGGLAYGMTIGQPSTDLEAIEGAATIKSAVLEPVIEYESPASWSHCAVPGPLNEPASCSNNVTFVAGEDLEAFRLITLNNDTQLVLADQVGSGTVLGMNLISAQQGEAIPIQVFGPISNPGWNWSTDPDGVFLGLDGLPTQTPPTSGYLTTVGRALSPTELFLSIEPTIQLL